MSLIALGWRAGLVVALTIPLVLAATFFVMSLIGIDLHRISLGALIIALGLLVDDAMIAVEMMDRKLEGGPRSACGSDLRLHVDGISDADRYADHRRRLHSRRVSRKATAGEYVSSLFWVTGIALVISWFAAVYFTPWIGYRVLKAHDREGGDTWRLQ